MMGPELLLLFIVGDILGAGVYAVTGDIAGEVGGARLAAVPGRVRGGDADRVLLPGAGDEVPPGRGCRALRAQGVRRALRHVPGRVHGRLLRHHQRLDRPPTCWPPTCWPAWTPPSAGCRPRRAPPLAVALAFMLLLAAINLRGVGESVKFNVVLTLVEITALLIVILIGFYVMATKRRRREPDHGVRDRQRPRHVRRRHRRHRDRLLLDGGLRGLGQHGRGEPRAGQDLPAHDVHRARHRGRDLHAGRGLGRDGAPDRGHPELRRRDRHPARGGQDRRARASRSTRSSRSSPSSPSPTPR